MPAVGSSSRSSFGVVARAMAISSWRCSPCDKRAAGTVTRSASPTFFNTSTAVWRIWVSERAGRQKRKLCPVWACTASATFSNVEKPGKILVIWNERASPSAARLGTDSAVILRPAK
jgi:hypothetical protein